MDEQRRTITDVRVLAALAHPVRVSLLHYLLAAGPRTATECSAVVDASPSACSYHLRHLERFGLVERAEPRPDEAVDGRTRRWRSVATGFSFGGSPSTASPEMLTAHHALVATGLAEDLRLARHHLDHADELPPEWQDAAEFSTYGLLVTVDEVAALVAAIDALARPLRAAVRRTAPPGARAVRLVVDAFARTDLE